jgi:hypothetical protein
LRQIVIVLFRIFAKGLFGGPDRRLLFSGEFKVARAFKDVSASWS